MKEIEETKVIEDNFDEDEAELHFYECQGWDGYVNAMEMAGFD
jgi:hypothetical protein